MASDQRDFGMSPGHVLTLAQTRHNLRFVEVGQDLP